MTIPLSYLVVHFIGDFILQNDWMAINKSRSWKALLVHTSLYSVCFFMAGWRFVLITFFLHTIVDAITSRILTRLWFVRLDEDIWSEPPRWVLHYDAITRHWFFVVIGLDQLIHFACLAWTLRILS